MPQHQPDGDADRHVLERVHDAARERAANHFELRPVFRFTLGQDLVLGVERLVELGDRGLLLVDDRRARRPLLLAIRDQLVLDLGLLGATVERDEGAPKSCASPPRSPGNNGYRKAQEEAPARL
jgi:hypothetical protein